MNWWDKIVFKYFLPTYTSIDWGRDPDVPCAVHFKRFRGKVYIVGIEFIRD